MPTPTGPRSSYALDGSVPNMTWAQFISNFAAPTDSQQALEGENISALGPYAVGASRTANVVGGEGQSGDTNYGSNPWNQFRQDLPDGTTNYYGEDANGGVTSANQTTNSDSWWDSTGLPLVASLAFGGATAGLSAAGIGATAGTEGLAAGEFGLDAGLGGQAWNAAGSLGGSAGGAATDIGSASYNPYNALNWTADSGQLANDASTVAQSSTPSFADSLSNGFNYLKGVYNGLPGVGQWALNTAGSTAAGDVLKGLTGGNGDVASGDTTGSGTDYSSFQPTPVDTSYINNGIQAPNVVQSPNGSYSDLTNYGSGSGSGLTGLLNSLGIGNSANPYSAYASLLGTGLSAYLGSNAATTAAGQQTSAINSANALNAGIYSNNVAMNKPFVDAGTGAVNRLANLNGVGPTGAAGQADAQKNFMVSDPGYQFTLDQGTKGVENSASAAGGLNSGRALKDLTTFNQGAASTQYGNAYNRLAGLATLGQNSANQTGNLGANYGGLSAALTTAGGIANSAGTIGSTNALTNALSQLLKNQGNGYYGGSGGV